MWKTTGSRPEVARKDEGGILGWEGGEAWPGRPLGPYGACLRDETDRRPSRTTASRAQRVLLMSQAAALQRLGTLNSGPVSVDTNLGMPRSIVAFALFSSLAMGQGVEPERVPVRKEPKGIRLETQLQRGQRFAGSNTVSYSLTTNTRVGQRESDETESVERTERFVDEIQRSEMHGVLEIDRTYTRLFTKARTGDQSRPDVYQSPLQGQKVEIRERAHRRDVKVVGTGTVEPLVRRTAGMEIDWRDVLPEDPVRPGDTWEGDAGSLSRALGAYLNCGTRAAMKVRFEDVVTRGGSKQAKLYVDWTVEGMRDKNLYTKVTLAGDVFFDLTLHRVVAVDLTGTMIVRGAIITTGAPRIIKGEGQVLVKSSLRTAEIDAAPEEGAVEEDAEGN